MSKILKSWISLENYEYLEKLTKRFLSSDVNTCLIVDDENRIKDAMKPLESYLTNQFPSTSFTILDISSLPKDTKTCLVVSRHEAK